MLVWEQRKHLDLTANEIIMIEIHLNEKLISNRNSRENLISSEMQNLLNSTLLKFRIFDRVWKIQLYQYFFKFENRIKCKKFQRITQHPLIEYIERAHFFFFYWIEYWKHMTHHHEIAKYLDRSINVFIKCSVKSKNNIFLFS